MNVNILLPTSVCAQQTSRDPYWHGSVSRLHFHPPWTPRGGQCAADEQGEKKRKERKLREGSESPFPKSPFPDLPSPISPSEFLPLSDCVISLYHGTVTPEHTHGEILHEMTVSMFVFTFCIKMSLVCLSLLSALPCHWCVCLYFLLYDVIGVFVFTLCITMSLVCLSLLSALRCHWCVCLYFLHYDVIGVLVFTSYITMSLVCEMVQ